MADQEISKAANGVSSQRSRRHLSHQAVPGDALGTAAGPAAKGDAGEVVGGTVTTAGRGLFAIRAQRYGKT